MALAQSRNDCSDQTPDGSDEPWYGQPCDGDDADLCADGVLTYFAKRAAEWLND